jgi:hypothetical protein
MKVEFMHSKSQQMTQGVLRMFHTAGLHMPQNAVQSLRFGQSISDVEKALQTLRQNGQKIKSWSLLYVPGSGRITQGRDPNLGLFRLFETTKTTGPKEYALEVGEAGQAKKTSLSQEQYDAVRTNCLRDIAAEKIGQQYGLEGLFGLTKLLEAAKTEVREERASLQGLAPHAINIEGVAPVISTAKKVLLSNGTDVTLMVRQISPSQPEYFVGLQKAGFPGQIIAASEDDEKSAFYDLFRANNRSLS